MSAALADLLAQRPELVPPAQDGPGPAPPRTALVPACGLGNDVLLLRSLGYHVWGLADGPDAVRAAEDEARAADARGLYAPVAGLPRGRAVWLAADFFDDAWSRGLGADGSGRFHLVFDPAFLPTLPPDARPRWARRMADLVHPKGRLVCLELPSDKPSSEPGPPWGLSPEVYEALLAAPGEAQEYNADGTVITTASPKPRDDALHRLSIIKPTCPHDELEFISVWAP